ncbi:MAG: hypothetical protein MZV70_01130 [Desulfobacterales bacterium]|nr:hypothetical protein [Desulfobacterales bacterium]
MRHFAPPCHATARAEQKITQLQEDRPPRHHRPLSQQFLGVKALVGLLAGSVAIWFVKLIDVFAWMESLAASRASP